MLVHACQFKRRIAVRLVTLIIVGFALLAVPASRASAAWPSHLGPSAWPTATSGSFRYHVQPAPTGTAMPGADAFRTEFGPVFDSAEQLAGSILATPALGTAEVYAYANPALFQAAVSARVTGLTPHSAVVIDVASAEVLIDLPELLAMSSTQVEDAVRNAVTQLTVQQIAQGVAPPGFAAGIALYVELPTSEYLARLASIVQDAAQKETLLAWFDLNRPLPAADRELALGESYAMISFLIDRYDIPALRTFLATLPASGQWQDALRTAYTADAASIEQEWRADLPRWTSSGWRDNLMASFDLGPARTLLDQGQYVAAKALLDPSLNLYRQLDDPDALTETQALMNEADTGIQAEALMSEVESALREHDYARASNLLDQAEIQYADLPAEQVPQSLLATYRQLASDGLTAIGQLAEADRLADSWGSYPEARSAAKSAGATFARLGDEENRQSSEVVLDRLDNRQRRLVVLMIGLGVITLIWLVLWLRARGPSDVKWA